MRAWHTARYKAITGYYYCERLWFTKEILSLYIKTDPLHLTIQRKLHIWQICLIFIVRYYTSFTSTIVTCNNILIQKRCKDKFKIWNMQIICTFFIAKEVKIVFFACVKEWKTNILGVLRCNMKVWKGRKQAVCYATEKLKDDYGLNGMGLRRKGFGSVICVCLPVCWETTERGAE